MPPDFAPMIVGSTLIIVTGAVVLLRPLTKRLGDLIQLMVEDRRRKSGEVPAAVETERLVEVLESIETRLSRLEEQQAFTDAVLRSGERPPLSPPEAGQRRS